jgi:hypothetical protein
MRDGKCAKNHGKAHNSCDCPASPVCCRQPEVGAIGLTISMATAPGAEMSTPAKNGPINAVTASAANGAGFDFGNVPG